MVNASTDPSRLPGLPGPPSQADKPLSRRDFLKLSGLGFLGAALGPVGRPAAVDSRVMGRVIPGSIKAFDIPSFSGESVRLYWQDMVLPITAVTVGDDEPQYNRIWYQIDNLGYAHSGSIQPVRTVLNDPVLDIPVGGQLAEVTVPFTDAHWGPSKSEDVAYRFYHETTHWVTGLLRDSGDNFWYQIADDKWDFFYYVLADHIRLVPDTELSPISPGVPLNAKRLEVDIERQIVTAYEWEQPVFATRAATGARFSNGKYYTPSGRHMTFHKRPSRHMARGNLAYNGFDLPGVPWVSYITKSGIAFHGTYWHNDYGHPRSHGCINLTSRASKWIYRWTLPVVPARQQRVYEGFGTIVDVI